MQRLTTVSRTKGRRRTGIGELSPKQMVRRTLECLEARDLEPDAWNEIHETGDWKRTFEQAAKRMKDQDES
jgi:hypothetical protein